MKNLILKTILLSVQLKKGICKKSIVFTMSFFGFFSFGEGQIEGENKKGVFLATSDANPALIGLELFETGPNRGILHANCDRMLVEGGLEQLIERKRKSQTWLGLNINMGNRFNIGEILFYGQCLILDGQLEEGMPILEELIDNGSVPATIFLAKWTESRANFDNPEEIQEVISAHLRFLATYSAGGDFIRDYMERLEKSGFLIEFMIGLSLPIYGLPDFLEQKLEQINGRPFGVFDYNMPDKSQMKSSYRLTMSDYINIAGMLPDGGYNIARQVYNYHRPNSYQESSYRVPELYLLKFVAELKLEENRWRAHQQNLTISSSYINTTRFESFDTADLTDNLHNMKSHAETCLNNISYWEQTPTYPQLSAICHLLKDNADTLLALEMERTRILSSAACVGKLSDCSEYQEVISQMDEVIFASKVVWEAIEVNTRFWF